MNEALVFCPHHLVLLTPCYHKWMEMVLWAQANPVDMCSSANSNHQQFKVLVDQDFACLSVPLTWFFWKKNGGWDLKHGRRVLRGSRPFFGRRFKHHIYGFDKVSCIYFFYISTRFAKFAANSAALGNKKNCNPPWCCFRNFAMQLVHIPFFVVEVCYTAPSIRGLKWW